MVQGGEPRRSGRQRKANTRYSGDVTGGLESYISPEPEDRPGSDSDGDLDSDKDVIFDDTANQDDDDEELDSAAGLSAGGGSSIASAQDETVSDFIADHVGDAEGSDVSRSLHLQMLGKGAKRNFPSTRGSQAQDEKGRGYVLHSQGLPPTTRYGPREGQTMYSFGRGREEMEALQRTVHKWFGTLMFPSRNLLRDEEGGMGLSFWQSDEARSFEAGQSWDWYYNFDTQRKIRDWQEAETNEMSNEQGNTLHFVAGLIDDQNLFELNPKGTMPLSHTWGRTPTMTNGEAPETPDESIRRGFIMNIGHPIATLEWVPNQPTSTQFLSISYIHSDSPNHIQDQPTHSINAFTPDTSKASTIELWRFEACETRPDATSTINTAISPQLALSLHFPHSGIKTAKWNPTARAQRDHDANPQTITLGLLALVLRDGSARILDVKTPRSPNTPPVHTTIATTPFTSRPPSSIFTSLTWHSAALISLGTAHGHVATYNLARHFSHAHPPSNSPPTSHSPHHTTYILNLAALTPSHPHLLTSSSLSGHLRLHDLRSGDHTLSRRTRVALPPLVWLDHAHHVLVTDESSTLKAVSPRAFATHVSLGKMDAPVCAVASSPCHALVLVGCDDGGVSVVNPLRRVVQGRVSSDLFRGGWAGHQWRRPRLSQDTGSHDFPAGLTRLTLSHTPENLTATARQAPRRNADPRQPYGNQAERGRSNAESGAVAVSTVHEARTGVIGVGWNGNLHVGGWAGVGWGDGMVIVEDICWD